MPALYQDAVRAVFHALNATGQADITGVTLHMSGETFDALMASGWQAGAHDMLFFGVPAVLDEDIPAGEIRLRREVQIQLPV